MSIAVNLSFMGAPHDLRAGGSRRDLDGLWVSACLSERLHVDDSPEIPARKRPIGVPLLRPARNRPRARQGFHSVCDHESFSHAVVAERQHVEPAESKMRNISALHLPMPFTAVSFSI